MGADGHVQIYSMVKLREKYDEEAIDSFFGHCGSSVMYLQELEGKEYLTRYWGDNIFVSDTYQMLLSTYDAKKDKFNIDSYDYDSYSAEYLMKLSRDHRQAFKEMIDFLEEECKITQWEVWT